MSLSFKMVDHIAVVVSDTEEALGLWRDKIGLNVLFSETVNNGTIRLTHLDLGNVHLQLVEPLTDPHPLRNWLQSNGGPGLHHVCLAVDDIQASFENLFRETGLRPAPSLHQGAGGKRALFIDSTCTSGIQLELTGKTAL